MTVALFVGDVGLDLTLAVPRHPAPDEKVHTTWVSEHCGGVIANAAAACHRQGQQARLLATLGDDHAGTRVRADLDADDVDTAAVTTTAGSTCRAVTLIEPHGEKRLVLAPGVTMYPTESAVTAANLNDISWIHTAIYDPTVGAILAARVADLNIPLSIDLEPATLVVGLDALRPVLNAANTVFVNAAATQQLGPDCAAHLLDFGIDEVILTLGRDGAYQLTATGDSLHVPAPVVDVVDTTGAGDCLAGTYIAGRLDYRTPPEALRRAVVAAAVACTQWGAQRSFPTPTEIEHLIDAQKHNLEGDHGRCPHPPT